MKRFINTLFVVILLKISILGQSYLKQTEQIKTVADSFFVIGEYDESLKYYQKELSVYIKNQDLHRMAIGYSNVSMVYHNKIDNEKAINYCRKALRILPLKSETDTTQFRIEQFLGLYFVKINLDSSNAHYARAERLVQKSKSVARCSDIISFYSDLGVKNFKNYNLQKAEIYFQKAINSLSLDKLYNKSVIFYNQGLTYTLQKKYEKAISNFKLAERNVVEKRVLYYILKEKGVCFQKLGKNNEAKLSFQAAWNTYKTYQKEQKLPPDLYFETAYFNSLGVFEVQNKNPIKAIQLFQQSIDLEKTQSKHSIVLTDNYRQLGEVYQLQNQPQKALQYYQKAIFAIHFKFNNSDVYQNPVLENTISDRELFIVLRAKASAFRTLYTQAQNPKDLNVSFKTYQLAIQLAEKIRKSYTSADSKAFFTENYFGIYQETMEVASQLQSINNQSVIFNIQEKSRATILADISREVEIKPLTISQDLLNQEKSINQQITSLQLDIRKQKDSLKLIELNKKLIDAQVNSTQLIDRFEREFPNYYQLKYDFSNVEIKNIQQKLDDKSTLISYSLLENELYIISITHSKSNVYKIKINQNFKKDLSDFTKNLYEAPQGVKYKSQDISARLYAQLIAPIESEIKDKTRLIIIRDAELNFLPFEVLAKQKEGYLLKKYAISYAYSASLLFQKKNTDLHQKMISFAPFANISNLKNIIRDDQLQALPATEQEIKNIGGDILLNENATKQHFMEQYQEAGIIHFATHAVTNDIEPNRSFIAFYPDNQGFKLMTEDLYNLDLRKSQLVVLSACKTGYGQLQKGEGIISLARAFACAGCPSVMTTLWNAHDETSAFLSEKLYEHLKAGLPKDEALQKAKLDFLSSEIGKRYPHPHYWANLILIGDREVVDFQDYKWLWIGLFLVLCSMGIFVVYRRKT